MLIPRLLTPVFAMFYTSDQTSTLPALQVEEQARWATVFQEISEHQDFPFDHVRCTNWQVNPCGCLHMDFTSHFEVHCSDEGWMTDITLLSSMSVASSPLLRNSAMEAALEKMPELSRFRVSFSLPSMMPMCKDKVQCQVLLPVQLWTSLRFQLPTRWANGCQRMIHPCLCTSSVSCEFDEASYVLSPLTIDLSNQGLVGTLSLSSSQYSLPSSVEMFALNGNPRLVTNDFFPFRCVNLQGCDSQRCVFDFPQCQTDSDLGAWWRIFDSSSLHTSEAIEHTCTRNDPCRTCSPDMLRCDENRIVFLDLTKLDLAIMRESFVGRSLSTVASDFDPLPVELTVKPTKMPQTNFPSRSPQRSAPTKSPRVSKPTISPIIRPTRSPLKPTRRPSKSPSQSKPTKSPRVSLPTSSPTTFPSRAPTMTRPTKSPSVLPTKSPRMSRPTRSPVGEYDELPPADTFASDLRAWEDFYDALEGGTWFKCRTARSDPCQCRETEKFVGCRKTMNEMRIVSIDLSDNLASGELTSDLINAFTSLELLDLSTRPNSKTPNDLSAANCLKLNLNCFSFPSPCLFENSGAIEVCGETPSPNNSPISPGGDTESPTKLPTKVTTRPTSLAPSGSPQVRTQLPTSAMTSKPTSNPSSAPQIRTQLPTSLGTTDKPTSDTTDSPSHAPQEQFAPSGAPQVRTQLPTHKPSTSTPTKKPTSLAPTSLAPSKKPVSTKPTSSVQPSSAPNERTSTPTGGFLSSAPSSAPFEGTQLPTFSPTIRFTKKPTFVPTGMPVTTSRPSQLPTSTSFPTTGSPTKEEYEVETSAPTRPTQAPTLIPTTFPTTMFPTTAKPTSSPDHDSTRAPVPFADEDEDDEDLNDVIIRLPFFGV